MQYKVEIDFKDGPTYSETVEAASKSQAFAEALRFARGCGWSEKIARSLIIEAKVPA